MTALLEKVLAQVYQLPDAEQDAVAVRLLQTLTESEQSLTENMAVVSADKAFDAYGVARLW